MTTTTQPHSAAEDFAQELRDNVIAIELMLNRVGRSRSLAPSQKEEVADHFGAKRRAVGGSKRLYAPNQPEIKRVASILAAARGVWMDLTISYRKGIRLLRKDQLPRWEREFARLTDELQQALAEADANREEILDQAREFLGNQLFDRSDYPYSFADSVQISWGVHNFEPSDELLQLAPETYQREKDRVRRQFEEAIACYEQEAREQLFKLTSALLDKLNDAAAGKKVVYTEAATTNLRDFFERFERLGITSDQRLAELVDDARSILGGTTMGQLKKRSTLRRDMAAKFDNVVGKLGALIMEAPARSISIDDLED